MLVKELIFIRVFSPSGYYWWKRTGIQDLKMAHGTISKPKIIFILLLLKTYIIFLFIPLKYRCIYDIGTYIIAISGGSRIRSWVKCGCNSLLCIPKKVHCAAGYFLKILLMIVEIPPSHLDSWRGKDVSLPEMKTFCSLLIYAEIWASCQEKVSQPQAKTFRFFIFPTYIHAHIHSWQSEARRRRKHFLLLIFVPIFSI